jgi:hypothetical protein
VIYAAYERTVLVKSVDDPESLCIAGNLRVLARRSPVVENDVIVFRAADGINLSQFQV